MVNIQDLFDDAKCYQTIREMRWPDGVTYPRCSSDSVIKDGRDDTEPHRQRYRCKGCRGNRGGMATRRTLQRLEIVRVQAGDPIRWASSRD